MKNHIKIIQSNNSHIISDRIPLNWKEIAVTSLSLFLIIAFFIELIVGVLVGLLMLIFYTLIRFTAWVYYYEIHINTKSNELRVVKKILNKVKSNELITNKFEVGNLSFKALIRSGETKYLMMYCNHKENDLLIVKSKEDKDSIEKYIMKVAKEVNINTQCL